MSVQEPATDIEARQDAAFRYDAARRNLSDSLVRHAAWVDHHRLDTPESESLQSKRTYVMEECARLAAPLTRYVEGEMARWDGPEIKVVELVDVDDVVAATLIAAVDRVEVAPLDGALYAWLRRMARWEVREAVLEAMERQRMERSLDDIADPVLRASSAPFLNLIQTLEDPHEALPDDMLIHDESRKVVGDILAKLPERWRESFLLSIVDGWTLPEIARTEGLSDGQVEEIVATSRAFLREWLTHELHIRSSADLR